MVAALGGRPADPAAQAIWGAAAVAIERYRQRHEVDGPGHPLVGKSATTRQQEDREALVTVIEQAVEWINTAERGVLAQEQGTEVGACAELVVE